MVAAGRARRRGCLGGDRGQASVELVALIPLLAVVALTVASFLAAHAAREAADQAAVAAAVAALQGGDAVAAGRSASPSWATVRLRHHRGVVVAEVAPRLPRSIAGLVDARAELVVDVDAQR